MKTLLLLALFAASPFVYAADYQVTYQVYGMEPAIADSLQTRLIAGGETAISAGKKLPDLTAREQVSLLSELTVRVDFGKRASQSSSKKKLEVDKRQRQLGDIWEATDGLFIECEDRSVKDGFIARLVTYCEYSNGRDENVTQRKAAVEVNLPSGIPVLLCRWESSDGLMMLLATSEFEHAPRAIAQPAAEPYGEWTAFETASSKQATARVVFPSTSNKNANAAIVRYLQYDSESKASGIGSQQLGFLVYNNRDPRDTSAWDANSPRGSIFYISEGSGTETTAAGHKLPKIEIRSTILKPADLTENPTDTPFLLESLADPTPKPDAWILRAKNLSNTKK